MNAGIVAIVVALVGAGGLGGWFSSYLTRRSAKESNATTASDKLIDQLQEEQAALRLEVNAVKVREEVRDDYIMVLRQHIADGKPPPPPPFPQALREHP